jgi:hypothetical protein
MSANVVTKFVINVLYNGVTQPLTVESHEQITAVLNRAEDLFHITQNRHLLSLFLPTGAEIPDNQSVEASGIKAGELIALRQGAVKGGCK